MGHSHKQKDTVSVTWNSSLPGKIRPKKVITGVMHARGCPGKISLRPGEISMRKPCCWRDWTGGGISIPAMKNVWEGRCACFRQDQLRGHTISFSKGRDSLGGQKGESGELANGRANILCDTVLASSHSPPWPLGVRVSCLQQWY